MPVYDHSCDFCGIGFQFTLDPATLANAKGKVYCSKCREGFLKYLQMGEGVTYTFDGGPGWCSSPPHLQRFKEYKALYDYHYGYSAQRPSIEKSAQSEEDSEELRLRNILTRPADKSLCPCGISRAQCTYHKPATPVGNIPNTVESGYTITFTGTPGHYVLRNVTAPPLWKLP